MSGPFINCCKIQIFGTRLNAAVVNTSIRSVHKNPLVQQQIAGLILTFSLAIIFVSFLTRRTNLDIHRCKYCCIGLGGTPGNSSVQL